jgi:transposase
LHSFFRMKSLPQTGTAALLQALTPYLDDGFISSLFPPRRTQGRRPTYSPAQLFRVLLLALLTPARSFNLLVKLLAENRAWRDFAFLPNKRSLPDAKMLHEFRDRLDLIKLRAINAHLLGPLLEDLNPARKTVAIIDSTDLPAGTNPFKKKHRPLLGQAGGDWRAHPQEQSRPMVCRLQKTYPAPLAD